MNQLLDCDIEDIEDLVPIIEQSFKVEFDTYDFYHVKTFGDFCDVVLNKINLANTQDCTSQQAFYKLRLAFDEPSLELHPSTELDTILPKKTRRKKIKEVERKLGFKLKLLSPPLWVIISVVIMLFSSIGLFWIDWKMAILGLIITFICGKLASFFGSEMELTTVGDLVKKMSSEHYLESRRDPKTFNADEVFTKIQGIFIDRFGLTIDALSREAKLFNK